MSTEIEEHVDALSTSKNIRDSLINSMVEGVLGINEVDKLSYRIRWRMILWTILMKMPKLSY